VPAVQLFDAHCHLDLLGAARSGALDAARQAGIRDVITVEDPSAASAVDEPMARQAAAPRIHRACGQHPWRADRPLDASRLRQTLESAVALGEVGLDGDARQPPLELQLQLLREQLKLAGELQLPLVLHCNKQHEPLLTLLAEHRRQRANHGEPLRGLVHGFCRGPELARRYVDLGLSIGLGARLRDPRARRLHETARQLPLDVLVLESDAPSDPIADLPQTARALAELRGERVERIAEETSRNARRLYGLDRVERDR
jgi:TatD DNase family protein